MDDVLQHYGILGQKWGVRRFQNEDRTLTSAGKKRYSTGTLTKIQPKTITSRSTNSNSVKSFMNGAGGGSGLSQEDLIAAKKAVGSVLDDIHDTAVDIKDVTEESIDLGKKTVKNSRAAFFKIKDAMEALQKVGRDLSSGVKRIAGKLSSIAARFKKKVKK